MFLHVTKCRYTGEYRVLLWFNNGVVKEADLKEELWGEVFEPLKDKEYFKQVKVNEETETIEWPNGADFAPEFLFDIGVETRVA